MADDPTKDYQVPEFIEISNPGLERPVKANYKVATVFGAESETISSVNARFAILEGLVRLLTLDIRFSDFIRDALLIALRVVPCEAGSILEIDHKAESLFFRAVVGQRSESLTNFTLPLGQGIVGHVAESGQALVVENIQDNKIHLKAVAKTVGFEVQNMVAVPILIRGKVFGVLEVLNRMGDEKFNRNDQEILEYFCVNLGKFIELRLMLAWGNYNKQAVELGDRKTSEAA